MSEADTPQSSNSSFDRKDRFPENDPVDELISALEEPSSSSEADQTGTVDNNGDEPWFEEETEENRWAELTNQLHERNHELLNRSAHLQQELETTQAQLEQHQFRLQQAENLNAQQNDELNAAYEQNLSLSQALKTAREKEQQQQEKIASLTHQLEVSQQRVAQLERECALIQKQFQEQSYKLCQAEKQSRELSLRLQQQRRHTWQFKCALNKYLETDGDNYGNEAFSMNSVPSQPIPAWSSQQQSVASRIEESASVEVSSLTEEEKSLPEISESSAEIAQEATQVDSGEETASAEQAQVNSAENPLDTMDVAISVSGVEPSFRYTAEETTSENTPAPTVTSNQHRKKRKSYASVELPNFIR